MHLTRLNAFASLRSASPALAGAPSLSSPFETLAWFDLLAQETIPASSPLHLLLATDATQALCLPLCEEAGDVQSLSNYYSGLFGPVTAGTPPATWQSSALAALFDQLRAEVHPAVIHLKPLDPESPQFATLRAALASAGYRVAEHFSFGNWYLPCAGVTYADFLAARPSALRNTIRRARGKLDQAGSWQLDIHTTADSFLEQALDDFTRIYQLSWKPAESHPQFIRAMCRLAAESGWLRLGVLRLAGQAIASQIWLFDNGKSYIFKLAYDPAAARYSPGSVLTAAMMEHALEHDHAREIDYLSGDDIYKQDWMSQRRERHGLIAFDLTTPRGLMRALRHFAGRVWRKLKP